MRGVILLVLLLALPMASGCMTAYGAPSYGPAEQASPAPADDWSPRMVVPATGGPPVLAMPLGGGMYLPVTGEPPMAGTPLAP